MDHRHKSASPAGREGGGGASGGRSHHRRYHNGRGAGRGGRGGRGRNARHLSDRGIGNAAMADGERRTKHQKQRQWPSKGERQIHTAEKVYRGGDHLGDDSFTELSLGKPRHQKQRPPQHYRIGPGGKNEGSLPQTSSLGVDANEVENIGNDGTKLKRATSAKSKQKAALAQDLGTSEMPASSLVGSTVNNCIRDLADQMRLVNDTIGKAATSQQGDQCPRCVETGAILGELQSQVRLAMQRVEKMNATLSVLQTHANLVQQSLSMVASQVLNAASITDGGTAMGMQADHRRNGNSQHVSTTREDGSSCQPNELVQSQADAGALFNVAARDGASAKEKGGGEEDIRKNNPQQSIYQVQQPWSNRAITKERLAGCYDGRDTLDELIMNCAEYLTGSAVGYIAWLREELDLETIPDLADALKECPELLVVGNGAVGVRKERLFRDAVLLAAATTATSSNGQAACGSTNENIASEEEGKEPFIFVSAAASASASKKQLTKPGQVARMPPGGAPAPGKQGAASTLSAKQQPSTMSKPPTSIGSTHSSTATTPVSSSLRIPAPVSIPPVSELNAPVNTSIPTHASKHTEEKKSKEANSQKQRKKAKEDKAAKLSLQREEEREEVDAEKKRRKEAKMEKQAAMARHEAEMQVQQKVYKRKVPRASCGPAVTLLTKVPEKVITQGTTMIASRQDIAVKNEKGGLPLSKRKKKVLTVDRLSQYLKSGRKGKQVSPIFNLIQNESTVEDGRKLMLLEDNTRQCKDEVADLVGQRARLERAIRLDKEQIATNQAQISEEERKIYSRWKVFGLSLFKKNDMDKTLAEMDNDVDEEVDEQEEEEIDQEAKRAAYLDELRRHNESVKQKMRGEDNTNRKNFMAHHLNTIRPFIEEKINKHLLDSKDTGESEPDDEDTISSQPGIVTTTLHDYQLEGFQWMAKMHSQGMSCILADEEGVDKTLQAVALIAHLKQNEAEISAPSLVICHKHKIYSLFDEIEKHAPSLDCFLYYSNEKEEIETQNSIILNDILKYDVVITSYDMIKDPDLIRQTYFNICVLDEGLLMKNEDSTFSQAVRKIHSRRKVILTQDPVAELEMSEIFTLLNFLYPQYFASSSKFDGKDTLEKSGDPNSLVQNVHCLLNLLVLRRLKDQVSIQKEDEVETIEEDAPPPSLDEVIEGLSHYINGPPSQYIDWLHSKGIKAVTDLGVQTIQDGSLLVAGNGTVGIKPESIDDFTSAVLDEMARGVGESAKNIKDNDKTPQESPEEKERRLKNEAEAKQREARAKRMAKGRAKEKKKSTRYKEVKAAKERIDMLKKAMERANKSIEEQKVQLAGISPPLGNKLKQLQKLRADITQIKGDGKEEDRRFHIDKSRDDRGFTILMVASANDDFLTAKICFDLGADAYAINREGLTAIDFSFFFGFEHMTSLIVQNGGCLPEKQCKAWDGLQSLIPQSVETSKNWDDALKIAETAALPAETLMESPEACEEDVDKKMAIISSEEHLNIDFTCFESRLDDPNINPDHVKRVILLDQSVYNWCLSTDPITKSNFVDVLEGLKPDAVRRPGVKKTKIHRRSIIGTATTYEILAARFEENSKGERVILFTPFVSGEVEGVASVGVLVWVVAPDSEASLYKTLVANTEFMRHKVKLDDRFLPHKESVLELGKDMHLLDLHSTSIWTTSTMQLFILNVDDGDLDQIHDPSFSAKKRIVHSEELVNKAIFRTGNDEAKENEGILASERLDMSSLIQGGAGTGKTLLMIKKVSKEERSRHVLVISRLPRLVNIIKTAVEEKRDDGVDNLSFSTYEELLQLLARRVIPDEDSQYKSFVQFDRIRFDCDDSNVSFLRQFVAGHLNSKEKKEMAKKMIDPLTLWHAIIVIKSHAKCAVTKTPLLLDDYILLPPSFGLTTEQRELCYILFLEYDQWRKSGPYWDEMDRVLYILEFGPSVFRDVHFISWVDRVNRLGEMDLLDDEGEPLYPFFYDIVCADETQDFTEIDLVLFAKMSSSIRSLFLCADPAQSVELGIKMREGTVNDVVHSLIKDGKQQVKNVLQYIDLQTNHRTHAQNLAIGQAIRRLLARSFKIPIVNERALINGNIPKQLSISKLSDLAKPSIFRGGNIVFLAPDEKVHNLRVQFSELGIKNDLFGVREAKGLEFDACALIGFFGFIEECGSSEQWQNAMRWLSSTSSLTKTDNTGEKVAGLMLVDCDYRLSAPNVSDEAMMLYTALTRSRNHLYLIEVARSGKGRKQKGVSLADFAFRRFADLKLAKSVAFIDEGHVEMTAAQHKARGVLYVTQALNMSRNREPVADVRQKFTEAMSRFGTDKGDDKDLFDKCKKHLDAFTKKHNLMQYAKEHFLVEGQYLLEGRFAEVLAFEHQISYFFNRFLCDSFLEEEVRDVRCLVEEMMDGTPYENHFKGICKTIQRLEQAV